jgi:SAM-dependent methyltransferase
MANERGQVATSAAEVYEEFFVPALFGAWPKIVLAEAAVGSGHRVLDVACGTGVLARQAMSQVGEDGTVVGLDANAGMLAVAKRMEPQIEWKLGIAEDLPFANRSFDRVVSQFGLMFFTDPHRAITEVARVTKAEGRVAIATWASLEETPGYADLVDLLDQLFGDEAAAALRAPYLMGDPFDLESVVASALPDAQVTRHDGVARFESIDDWVHTDIRGWTLSEMIDDAGYARLLGEARRRLARYTDENGRVAFSAPALIATASGVGA